MAGRDAELGRRIAVYPVAAAYVQRAVFLAVLAFMFFLAMMFAFYVRQSLLYFLLSTAFLIVYLITMFSWVMLRKAAVEVFEHGFKHRRHIVLWNEIASINGDGEIILANGKKMKIPSTVNRAEELVTMIGNKMHSANSS